MSHQNNLSVINNRNNRVTIIEPLRGVASLAVCWFHFTNGTHLLSDGVFKASGLYGWLGVEVFFVISGFVIPLSLYRANFNLRRHWSTFAKKRILRLDPPYLATIVLIIALAHLSAAVPGFAGKSPNYSLPQIMLHLGYLNAFFHYAWLNPVFWTLAIEAQYYVLIALLFPLVAHRSYQVRLGSIAALCALSFTSDAEAYLLNYLCLFSFGILAFNLNVGLMDRYSFCIWLAIIGIASFFKLGLIITMVGLATAIVISFVQLQVPKFLIFLGAISYSLYLVHVPIGGRVINLAGRFAHTLPSQICVVFGALIVSIVTSYLMYWFIERPAQMWSSSLRYSTADS